MSRKIIHTDEAPEAIGPYSQAVINNGTIYCSGQIPLKPVSMEMAGDNITAQTRQVMKNLEAVLKAAGSGFNKVVKCSIFLDNMDDFKKVNAIYGEYFTEEPPARETVAVETLPKNAKVEISCIAKV